MNSLLILSPQLSPRLQYVCEVIFKNILSLDFDITTDTAKYQNHQGLKLRYLPQSQIVFEDNIHPQDENQILNDKVALAFYLLSNYEEYLPDCPRDQHQRIVHEKSFVVRHHLEKTPTVHNIALKYKELLSKQQADFQWRKSQYRFLPTFDVDIAYAYKGKSFFHFCGALAKACLCFHKSQIKNILQARHHDDFDDPYDGYDQEKELCERNHLKPIYFMLTSRRTRYDRNISPKSAHFSALIDKLKSFSTIGLHTSYYSNNQEDIIYQKNKLEKISGLKVNYSRQHFLKEKMPETFQNLISTGISDDFSLGFYDRIGFRNGMALPYPFFDLSQNKTTTLTIHPLLFMDSAAFSGDITFEQYENNLNELLAEVKKVGGEMVALWHNNFMPQGSQKWEIFLSSFNKML